MQETEFTVGKIRPIECYKESWELIKGQFWILFAIVLVGMLIGGASMYILFGAMLCGIFYSFLQAIDGEKVSFESLFKGFNYILPGLVVTAVIVVPMFVLFGAMYVPMILLLMSNPNPRPEEMMSVMFGMFAVEIVLCLLMVCVHTLLMFSYPLIIERNMSGWQAIKTSARAVWQNLSGVVGLIAVGFVVGIIGYLVFCVGVYFAIPIIFAANAVAYRKVFPAPRQNNFQMPPPPGDYQGTSGYN